MIFAASNGYVDAYPETDVQRYEKEMIEFLRSKHADIIKTISEKKAISDDSKKALTAALNEFKAIFQPNKK
jgi:F-type H+-transporting ATPase subunit alpha